MSRAVIGTDRTLGRLIRRKMMLERPVWLGGKLLRSVGPLTNLPIGKQLTWQAPAWASSFAAHPSAFGNRASTARAGRRPPECQLDAFAVEGASRPLGGRYTGAALAPCEEPAGASD
jgi:hypothetical protein